MSLKRCNTCNAEFNYWETFAEGGEKIERCPVCNNTKQMSDAVEEFKGQTEVSMRPCDFCGQEYSFKDTKTNVCPTCKEEALKDQVCLVIPGGVFVPEKGVIVKEVSHEGVTEEVFKQWPDFSTNGRIYKESRRKVDAEKIAKQTLPPSEAVFYEGVLERAVKQFNSKQFIPSSGPHPFQVITDEMYRLYVRKNHDYGNSFAIQFQKLGMASSIIRLSDKLSRLESLHGKQAQVSDESIRDTLIDLANYAVLTIMEIDAASDKSPKE